MAAPWDILGKAANLVQLLGLEAFTLITIAVSFLRLREIRKECQKLEERVWMLRLLLCSPAGYWIMTQQQQHLELADLVTNALRDAHGLVECYNESTLFARVRRGRCMARQFRDLHNRMDYCLIVTVAACLPIAQANSPLPSLARNEANDRDVPTSDTGSTDAETSTGAPGDIRIINISQE